MPALYWHLTGTSYRFGISIKLLLKWIQKSINFQIFILFEKKTYFLEVTQIETFLYSFYSEFYADSESVTFFRFTSIYWEILALKVMALGQNLKKRHFWDLCQIRHGYGLFWYKSICFGQGYSGLVLGRYVKVCGSRCRFRG